MKNKKTSGEIKESILNILKDGPKTITEIGELANSNWLTIEQYLKDLRGDGEVVEVVSSSKMKVYRRADDLAFYALPYPKKIRENNFALLCKIAKIWKEKNKTEPPKTILQKIAVELIENPKDPIQGIPVLRFHYGKTTAIRYDEKFEGECNVFQLSKHQHSFLTHLIYIYKDWSSKQVQIKQYSKKGMEIYQEKENTIKALNSNDEKSLELSLLKLTSLYPAELEMSFNSFDKLVYCSIVLLKLKDKESKEVYKNKLKEIFYLIWDSFTTEAFFYDSEKYIESEKKELFHQIKFNILNSKISNIAGILDDLEAETNSINPKDIENETSEKTKDFLNEIMMD